MVLVATRNPLNIGAAARAMANFGFSRLRVVNAYDVAFREARSAVGAAPLLRAAEDYSSLAEAVADCELVVGTTSLGHRGLRQPLKFAGMKIPEPIAAPALGQHTDEILSGVGYTREEIAKLQGIGVILP